MGFKDIVAIGVVMLVSTPLVYLAMLFSTNNARIEFGPPSKLEQKQGAVEVLKRSPRTDSLMATQAKSFVALQNEREGLEQERQRLAGEQQRLEMLRSELEQERQRLQQEREKIEQAVSRSDSLDAKRIKQLAAVYGAMRATEAATILETLNDALVINLLKAISDDRQKAKIMGALSPEKASRISTIMGKTRSSN